MLPKSAIRRPSAHSTHGRKSRPTPCVEIHVGDIGGKFQVFVQDNLGHDLILGQTWRAPMRNILKCRQDGTEAAIITAMDDSHSLEVKCVERNDPRHRRYLKPPHTDHIRAERRKGRRGVQFEEVGLEDF